MDTTLDPPPAPPPATEPPGSHRQPALTRLTRNTSARVLGGVAAGLADHFGIDVVLVRLAFVVGAFFGGLGVLAYLIAWIVLPSATLGTPAAPRDQRQLLGYGLVALGLATVPSGVGFGWRLRGAFWPLALVALGGAVLWLRTRDDRDDPPEPPPAAPTATRAPPAAVAAAPFPDKPDAPSDGDAAATRDPGVGLEAAAAPAPVAPDRPPERAGRVRQPRPPRGPVTAITLSALLILGGVAWLLDATGSGVDLAVVAAVGLTVVGAGLVASAWIGRARALVVLGLLLALVVGAFGAIDVPIRGGIGDTTYRPTTAAAVGDRYRMAIGRLTLDLRDAPVGRRTEVTASVGLGRLVVRVPDGVRLVVHGHAGVGSVALLGRDHGDCCPTDEHVVRTGDPGSPTLVVHARVGAGAVEVTSGATVAKPIPLTPAGAPAVPPTPSLVTPPGVPVPTTEADRAAA